MHRKPLTIPGFSVLFGMIAGAVLAILFGLAIASCLSGCCTSNGGPPVPCNPFSPDYSQNNIFGLTTKNGVPPKWNSTAGKYCTSEQLAEFAEKMKAATSSIVAAGPGSLAVLPKPQRSPFTRNGSPRF